MNTPQQPTEPVRKRYRLRPAGCCDVPRTVLLTDAEAAPGIAKGLLTPLSATAPAAPQPQLPRNFAP